MIEVVIVVESEADARTATKLAERVLLEKIDWLEPEYLDGTIVWQGFDAFTQRSLNGSVRHSYSCWRDIKEASQGSSKLPRYRGHGKNGPLKTDGATAAKIFKLIGMQKQPPPATVILIRDLDNQPERRKWLEQAREEYTQIPAIVGTADRNREAWVLNGFLPANSTETALLEKIEAELNFHPCLEAHRLRANASGDNRNPKLVLDRLTSGDFDRQQQCWTETCLKELRTRGVATGLTSYLKELEERLVPLLTSN